MKTLKIKWTGLRPLVMSNPQTVKVSNPFAVESRRIGNLIKASRKKQDEDKMAELESVQLRNDWEASAYWDAQENKFFIPDTLLMACIRGGATMAKKGKDVDRALLITETQAYIETKAHKTLDAAFKDESFRLECPCKIPPRTGALIWKCRCMIPTGWVVNFQIEYDENIFAAQSILDALQNAGAFVGIGGWRPKFGRFLVEVI